MNKHIHYHTKTIVMSKSLKDLYTTINLVQNVKKCKELDNKSLTRHKGQ